LKLRRSNPALHFPAPVLLRGPVSCRRYGAPAFLFEMLIVGQ
jgi:hypothetical protein